MLFLDREEIPVVFAADGQTAVPYADLARALEERRASCVCIESNGRFRGIATNGDITRARAAGLDAVPINERCTSCGPGDAIRARRLFHERKNIVFIPVVDAEGNLLGAYTSCDNLLFLEHWSSWESNPRVREYLASTDGINLVWPLASSKRKVALAESWEAKLADAGAKVNRIDLEDIPQINRSWGEVLFVDGDDRAGVNALAQALGRPELFPSKRQTFYDMLKTMTETSGVDALRRLEDQGVNVIVIESALGDTPYQRNLHARFKERDSRLSPQLRGQMEPSEGPAFYGELFTEDYLRQVGLHAYKLETTNSAVHLADFSSDYINIANGKRRTVGQPESAEHTAYFIGPCIMVGPFVEDRHTLPSSVQALLNRDGISCRAVNCGCWENSYSELVRIASIPFRPGDYAIVFFENQHPQGFDAINLAQVLEDNDVPREWLVDSTLHCNDKVNALYAEEIYAHMLARGVADPKRSGDDAVAHEDGPATPTDCDPAMDEKAVKELYLDRYFSDFEPASGETIGAVCMHGNPFTYGHRRLIEFARERVDRLVVFVIDEELGEYTFPERYSMACECLADLEGITIAPSGPFQATRTTFPEYFSKVSVAITDAGIRAELDVFARCIAKPLGISVRFIGTERPGTTMQVFNDLIREILPEYGIDVVEVPRFATDDGDVFSASKARTVGSEDRAAFERLCPPATVRYAYCE